MSVWLGNPYQNTGLVTQNITCTSSAGTCPTTDGFFNPDPTKQPTQPAALLFQP